MGRDWIVDVLADLRVFARANDMPRLGARLEDAEEAAILELSQAQDRSDPASAEAAQASHPTSVR